MIMSEESLSEHVLKRDRFVSISLIFVLFALAAVYTAYGVGMPMSAFDKTAAQSMSHVMTANSWTLKYSVLVFLMWWVMMAAMMLPSVAPTVLLYVALRRNGMETQGAPSLSTFFLLGYLIIWAGFSIAATFLQWLGESLGFISASNMALTNTVFGGLIFVAAGLFQFTPLKTACLNHCRSPVQFLTQRHRSGALGALSMGLEHGMFCLGCCWFLMALLFVGGIMNLYWIVGIAAFIAVERLSPRGDLVSKIASIVVLIWGITVVAKVGFVLVSPL